MTESKIGVALKATPLLIALLAMLLAPALQAQATVIRDLRFGDNKGYVRMVLELDRPLNPPPSITIQRNTLQVALTGIINNQPDLQTDKYHGDVIGFKASHMADTTHIDAVFSFDPAEVKTFSLTDPHRFIIDVYRPLSPAAARPPAEKAHQTELIEESVSLPESYSDPHKPLPAMESPSLDEASTQVHGSASPNSGKADNLHRNRFRQRLIAALIVVTSILVVLLFLLIWMGNSRKRPVEQSWVHDLPPTKDRNIESIDTVIGDHLNNHDRR